MSAGLRIEVLETPAAVARAAAERVARAAERRPELVLGLPTGRTMVPVYAELARRHAEGRLDLARARAFNVDELLLPPGHPASFHAFMARHGWERIGLPRERSDIPRGDLEGEAALAAECRRYDRAIAEAGGLDLVLLGLGADGHVAYNLPGPPRAETHVVRVPPEVADTLDGPLARRPLEAITVGFEALLGARRVVLLATTPEKARAVAALAEGRRDEAWPCTLLAPHPRLEVILTPEAAARLERAPALTDATP